MIQLSQLDTTFLNHAATLHGWLNEPGYGSLFIVGMLASSILPMGSEWLLILMLSNGYLPWLTVATASAGNCLGAVSTYLIGVYGGRRLIERVLRVTPEQEIRARWWFHRYGKLSLLFSWLPIIGDPLCLVSGMLGTKLWVFLALVTIGKVLRYTVIAWIILATVVH